MDCRSPRGTEIANLRKTIVSLHKQLRQELVDVPTICATIISNLPKLRAKCAQHDRDMVMQVSDLMDQFDLAGFEDKDIHECFIRPVFRFGDSFFFQFVEEI